MSEKKVFISHSSKDFEVAKRFCDAFEEDGIGCWIAPRDIPYGVEWAETIVKGIRSSGILIVLITKYSIESKQVIREINEAVQNNINILSVRLDTSPLSDGLKYYLDILQKVDLSSELTDGKIHQLITCVKNLFLKNNDKNNDLKQGVQYAFENRSILEKSEYTSDYVDHSFKINEVLESTFRRTFSSESFEYADMVPVEYSPFRKKIMDRLCHKILEDMISKDNWNGEENAIIHEDNYKDLESSGFRFSIEETEGYTLVFIINRQISPETYKITFVAEQLKYFEGNHEDGSKTKTFFYDNKVCCDTELLLLTILEEKDICLVNNGYWYVKDRLVKISNTPIVMEMQLADDGKVRFRSDEKFNYLIVDPIIKEMVEPKKYYDIETQQEINIVELSSHHLIAINLNPEGQLIKASNYEIGNAYFYGIKGLRKNWMKAAEYFDLDRSSEAIYFLGRIFSEDPILANEEDAEYYFRLARDAKKEENR